MALLGGVPTTAVDTQDAQGMLQPPSEGWRNYFQAVYAICNALTMSGTTAQRPTVLLWPGRMYFDTSLGANGKPIWRNKGSTGWVLADGTAA